MRWRAGSGRDGGSVGAVMTWSRPAGSPEHRARHGARVRGLTYGLGAIAAVSAADLVIGNGLVPLTAVVIGPLVAAIFVGPRMTAAVGAVAFATALALGIVDGQWATRELAARLVVIAAGSGVAVILSGSRVRQSEQLDAEQAAHEARMRDLFERSAMGMMLVRPDGLVSEVNEAMCDLVGATSAELVGQVAGVRVHPDDRKPQDRAKVLAGELDRWEGDLRLRHVNGSWRWVRLTASPLGAHDGHDAGVLLQLADITADKEAEAELSSMVEVLHEAVIVFDKSSVIRASNQAAADLCGCELSDIAPGAKMPQWIFDRVLDADGAPIRPENLALNLALAGQGLEDDTHGFEHPQKGRRWYAVSTRRFDLHGHERIAVSLIDRTDSHLLQQTLQDQATHDPLTGLVNRRVLEDRLAVALAGRSGGVAVLFVDVDHFKSVNDTRGHAVGDQLLIHVATQLQGAVRPHDTVCRFAGDEFVVICPDCASEVDAARVAGRVLEAAEVPVLTRSGPLVGPVSIGVTFVDLPTDLRPDEVLRRADSALYSAKEAGRGRYVLDPTG